mmetsp:Transcript_47908/g.124381  ORF Transcript_47908/g.124381 Transcript_47908/m.124381 type:complete len:97 (+) Transcript_47908:3359-3649(+)
MSSSCEPCSTTMPFFMTKMISAFRTVDSLWAITIVVRPFITFSSASCTTASDLESSALVASSKSIMRGSRMMALAMAIRCFWPPDNWAPLSPTKVW